MPEEKDQKPEYGDRYADIRFQYLDKVVDRMEKTFEKTMDEIRSEVKEIRSEVKEIKVEVDEIKKDNRATRRWVTGTVIGTGIAVISGIGAISFAFAQIQTSWMQQVISFALKAIK